MNAVRASPEGSDNLIERVRLGVVLVFLSTLPPDPLDHCFDVFGYLIVHVRHETPSKDHLGSLPILAGVCLT
jgi:hypothetical protein